MNKKLIDYIKNCNISEYYLKQASDILFPHINSNTDDAYTIFYPEIKNDKYYSILSSYSNLKENFDNGKYIEKRKYFKCSKQNLKRIENLVKQLKEEIKKEEKIKSNNLIFFIKEAFDPIIIDKSEMKILKIHDMLWSELFDSTITSVYKNDDLNFSILMMYFTKLGYDKQSMYNKKVKNLFKDL